MWPKYLLYLILVAKISGILNTWGQNNQIRIWFNNNLETAKVLPFVCVVDACMRACVCEVRKMSSLPQFWPDSPHPQKRGSYKHSSFRPRYVYKQWDGQSKKKKQTLIQRLNPKCELCFLGSKTIPRFSTRQKY